MHLGRNSQIVGSLVFFYCPFALEETSTAAALANGAVGVTNGLQTQFLRFTGKPDGTQIQMRNLKRRQRAVVAYVVLLKLNDYAALLSTIAIG